MNLADLPPLMTAVSAAAAALAAIATWIQSDRIRAAYEAEVLILMAARYNTPEMAEALRLLVRSFGRADRGFPDRWQQEYLSGSVEAQRINSARRLVSAYFIDISRLLIGRAISRRLAKELTRRTGLNVFYEICEPLNNAHNPERNMRYVRQLKKIRRSYGRHAKLSAEEDFD